MTTLDLAPRSLASSFRRIDALAEMELRILWRNKTALFIAVALAPAMVPAAVRVFQGLEGGAFSGALLVSLSGFALLFSSYYNLTTMAVARREERMLTRLTAGEVSRVELLVAMAVPHALLALVQVILAALVLGLTVGGAEWSSLILALLAFLGGAAVCSMLAFAVSGRTRSVEAAQLTTMPVLIGASLLSGLIVPLHVLPEPVARVAELTPLAPVVDLLRLGIAGIGPDGSQAVLGAATAGRPLLVLLAWILVGAYLVRRSMRWDVRR